MSQIIQRKTCRTEQALWDVENRVSRCKVDINFDMFTIQFSSNEGRHSLQSAHNWNCQWGWEQDRKEGNSCDISMSQHLHHRFLGWLSHLNLKEELSERRVLFNVSYAIIKITPTGIKRWQFKFGETSVKRGENITEEFCSALVIRSTAISFLQYSYQMYPKHTAQVNDWNSYFIHPKNLLLIEGDKKVDYDLNKCHSQLNLCLFLFVCTTLTLKKLLAILYVQVNHRIPTLVGVLVFCVSYTGYRKKKKKKATAALSLLAVQQCTMVKDDLVCEELISNIYDFRDHLHAGKL